jgi:hypothetical protein
VTAAGEHDAQAAVELGPAASVQQLRDLGLELRSGDAGEAEVRGGALETVEMVGERERRPS